MRKVQLILAALAVLVGALAFLLTRCSHPAPRVSSAPAMPASHSQANASGSAAVTASQVTQATVIIDDLPEPPASGSARPPEMRRRVTVTLVATQAIAVAASSSAAASASVDHFAEVGKMMPDHGRVGVILATMPGAVALDVELLRAELPPWLLGAPMEVGLDVAGNLEAGAVGLSCGSKAFILAGAWSRYNLSDRGWYVGAGMRF